jgi:hypothetical protein
MTGHCDQNSKGQWPKVIYFGARIDLTLESRPGFAWMRTCHASDEIPRNFVHILCKCFALPRVT